MTLGDALRLIRAELAVARIACPGIEAELLLCHALEISRLQAYSEPERPMTPRETAYLRHLARRRTLSEPLAYILHRCEFCGVEFYVDRRVLIPRPETEFVVEKAAECVRQHSSWSKQVTVADIGTGCGAIAVNLALALPSARIYATDISASALQVAQLNCRRHKVEDRVDLLQGSLLAPVLARVDCIAGNLPYVSDCELQALEPQILDFEPVLAIAGGGDGLDTLRLLLAQVPEKLNPGGCMILEMGQEQDKMLRAAIAAYLPQATVELIADLTGAARVICIRNSDGSR